MASSLGILARERNYVADSHHFETYQHAFLWDVGCKLCRIKVAGNQEFKTLTLKKQNQTSFCSFIKVNLWQPVHDEVVSPLCIIYL